MDTLLIFFVNYSFLDKVEKNQKPVFKLESPSCFLNGAQALNPLLFSLFGYPYIVFSNESA